MSTEIPKTAHERTQRNNQEQKMNEPGIADFPMGRGGREDHPKRQMLRHLIGQNAPEYARADKWAEFGLIRSKHTIITAVGQELMADGGRFVIKKKNGLWVERVGFNSETKEVRVLVQERFNRLIRSWKRNLPPFPPLAQPQPVHDADEDQPGGYENVNEISHAVPAAVDQPNPAPAPDDPAPMGDDVTEAERSLSSSEFSSVLHSVDMSQPTADVILNGILHDLPSQGSSRRGTVQPARDGSEVDHHQDQENIEMGAAQELAQEHQSALLSDNSPLNADERNVTASLRSERLSVEHNRAIINEQGSEVGNYSASVGTFSASNDESLQVVGDNLTVGSTAPDSEVRGRSNTSSASTTEVILNASIGTFSASKESSQVSEITGDLPHDESEGNDKRSRSGSTKNSLEPPTNKLRVDSSCILERQQISLANDPLAPASPVGVLFDRLSLLDDTRLFNDDNVTMDTKTNSLAEDYCVDRTMHRTQELKNREGSGARSVRSSVGLPDLEITFKHDDMQSTGTGLGNVGGLSAAMMLSALTKQSLNANDTKRLLDDLSDRVINEDRQLMGKSVTNRAARIVLNLMENHAKDTSVLFKSFTFAMQLYGIHESPKISHGFIEQIIRVLQSPVSNANLMERGWWLLRVLGTCDPNAMPSIANPQQIEWILNVMRQYSREAGIQIQGSALVGRLAFQNAENKCAIADANGIAVILQAMRPHEQHGEVQEYGCYALGQLAFENAKNKCAIADANGIDVILQAMRLHEHQQKVQQWGCYALGELAFENAKNQCAIADAKGIGVILQAMRLHEQHEKLQDIGCYALGQLAFANENQCAIADAKGIDVILQAMRLHKQHEKVQEHGCYALAQLAFGTAENKCAIADANGIDAILQAMRLHKQHLYVQHWGRFSLAILAQNNEASWHVISESSRDVLVRSIQRFRETDRVQKHCGMVLRWVQQPERSALHGREVDY